MPSTSTAGMPSSLSRRSRVYSVRASRSEISLSANTSPPSATNRTTCREMPRCGISVIRSSVHSSSGESQGRSSRPAAASAGGLKTKCTGRSSAAGSGDERVDQATLEQPAGDREPPVVEAAEPVAAAAQAAVGLDDLGPLLPLLDVRPGDQAVGVVHPEPALLPGPPPAVHGGRPLGGLGEVSVEG